MIENGEAADAAKSGRHDKVAVVWSKVAPVGRPVADQEMTAPPDCVAALKAKNLATTAGSKQLLLPALRATLLQSYMPAAEAAQAPTAMETA